MPVYEYECAECGRYEEALRSIPQRHKAPLCHGKMKLVIGARTGFVQKTFDPYISPATENLITSHAARRDDFARSSTREWEGFSQERREAQRRVAESERKSEERLDRRVHEAYHQMPLAHRRAVEGR